MTKTQGLGPQREHSKRCPKDSVLKNIHQAAWQVAIDEARNRWSFLLQFDGFLTDMEGLGIQRGLHNSPGAYEALDHANVVLSEAMADCIAQIAQLEAAR